MLLWGTNKKSLNLDFGVISGIKVLIVKVDQCSDSWMLTLAGLRVSRCGFTRRSGAEPVTWLVSEARKEGKEGQSHSSCIFCTWLPSDQLSPYQMKLFVKAFWFLKVVSWVARDDRASGRPCCGTCFPSWDPNTLVVLKEEFFWSRPLLRYEATVPMFVVSEEFSWCKKARLPREKIPFHLGIDCPLTPPPTLQHAMWANISLFKKFQKEKVSK